MTAQLSTENSLSLATNGVYELPPLILHPFAEPAATDQMLESSRASLVLQGLLPAGESASDVLQKKVLEGRYAEMRMLFYVGLDVCRWIGQCLEHIKHKEGFLPEGVTAQSFAALLVRGTPGPVADKLRNWGVADFASIFSRALGLNAMFAALPARELLSDDFLRNYFRYADQLYITYLHEAPQRTLDSAHYRFDLYSSGEYSRLLERAWE